MATMFFANFTNGFSGINIFTHYYFSLFNVIDTNWDTIFYANFSNDVLYDPSQKKKMVSRASQLEHQPKKEKS